jgi:hypothetical protein
LGNSIYHGDTEDTELHGEKGRIRINRIRRLPGWKDDQDGSGSVSLILNPKYPILFSVQLRVLRVSVVTFFLP